MLSCFSLKHLWQWKVPPFRSRVDSLCRLSNCNSLPRNIVLLVLLSLYLHPLLADSPINPLRCWKIRPRPFVRTSLLAFLRCPWRNGKNILGWKTVFRCSSTIKIGISINKVRSRYDRFHWTWDPPHLLLSFWKRGSYRVIIGVSSCSRL
jgi:hypothetical protein